MAKDRNRARQIAQVQKQRQQEKAAVTLPAPTVQLERRITFRLDAARLDELEAYARREGFTVSVIIRHLVCRFLEDQRRFSR